VLIENPHVLILLLRPVWLMLLLELPAAQSTKETYVLLLYFTALPNNLDFISVLLYSNFESRKTSEIIFDRQNIISDFTMINNYFLMVE
jgi:hypothetical protein